MARVTVEDCLPKTQDRFELVILAANRARALSRGQPSSLPRERDKDAVLALREIADGNVEVEQLRGLTVESLIKRPRMSRHSGPGTRRPSASSRRDIYPTEVGFPGKFLGDGFTIYDENDPFPHRPIDPTEE